MFRTSMVILALIVSGVGAASFLRGCTEPVDVAVIAALPDCEKTELESGTRSIGRKGKPVSGADVELVRNVCEQNRYATRDSKTLEAQQKAMAK